MEKLGVESINGYEARENEESRFCPYCHYYAQGDVCPECGYQFEDQSYEYRLERGSHYKRRSP